MSHCDDDDYDDDDDDILFSKTALSEYANNRIRSFHDRATQSRAHAGSYGWMLQVKRFSIRMAMLAYL